MLRVPREKFVPRGEREFAYGDYPLRIGHGQTISQPYIVAYMVEALDLKGGEKVLEVGAGSGYAAAVLAEMGRFAEADSLLATGAVHHHLVDLGLRCDANIIVETGVARDPHHFACLIGYGATAVYPYLVYQSLHDIAQRGNIDKQQQLGRSFRRGIRKGLFKVMSKITSKVTSTSKFHVQHTSIPFSPGAMRYPYI